MEDKQTCIMEKDGICRSDYNYGCKCDGVNLPKSCPYANFKTLRKSKISSSSNKFSEDLIDVK